MLRPNCTHQIVILEMHFLGDEMNLNSEGTFLLDFVRNTIFVLFFLE